MALTKLFLVEHFIDDRDATLEKDTALKTALKNSTSIHDAQQVIMQEGCLHHCELTLRSIDGGSFICSLWRTSDITTVNDFQTFMNDWYPGSKTKCWIVPEEQAAGISQLTNRNYIKDLLHHMNTGTSLGFANGGDLFVVHHHIHNPQEWKEFCLETARNVREHCNLPSHVPFAIGAPVGFEMTAAIPTTNPCHAFSLWTCPEGTPEDAVQEAVDTWTKAAMNVLVKVDTEQSINLLPLAPEAYCRNVLDYAKIAKYK
jgi:hypothetical protein